MVTGTCHRAQRSLTSNKVAGHQCTVPASSPRGSQSLSPHNPPKPRARTCACWQRSGPRGQGWIKPHCKQGSDAVDRPTVSACAVRHMRGSQVQSFPTTGQTAPPALHFHCHRLAPWESRRQFCREHMEAKDRFRVYDGYLVWMSPSRTQAARNPVGPHGCRERAAKTMGCGADDDCSPPSPAGFAHDHRDSPCQSDP